MEVQLVRTEEQATHVRVLAWELVDWMRDRYPEMVESIGEYLETQKFEHQLDGLLTYFNPPEGECLLASEDGVPLGIVMLKPFEEDECEMNRMFVRSEARGKGVARALCNLLIIRARELGYKEMVLDALDKHDEAISLYKSLGFKVEERIIEVESAQDRVVPMRISL